MILSIKQITKALIRLRGCAGWSAPLLFANPKRQVLLRRGPYTTLKSIEFWLGYVLNLQAEQISHTYSILHQMKL